MLRRLPIVGVFGQGTRIGPDRAELARQVGAMVARLGAHLLTGGGYGVMEAVADGFVRVADRAGFSIGIVPREPDGPLEQPNHDEDGRPYPNAFVEIPIMTPLAPGVLEWRSVPARNHVNVFTPDAVVALPGHSGTRNELDMTAAYRDQAARAPEERRVVLVGPAAEFTAEHRGLFMHATSVPAAEARLARILATRGFPVSEAVGERVD
jgi:uncharacterized protein (TIGR00725 family)